MHQDAPTTTPAGNEAVIGDDAEPATTGTPQPPAPGRRTVIRMGAATGLGVAAAAGLAACGSDSGAATAAPADGAAGDAGSAPPAGGQADGSSPAGDGASGGALAKLSDVPVGGAFAAAGADGKPIVIAQPKAGQVVAFSATCTHQGCKVAPEGKILNCPCHGATYDAFTGKNLSGPAPKPLPAVAVKVNGTDIVAG